MSFPQDPNQPVQPGAPESGGAAPEWGQQPQTPPDPNQPGWGAPTPPPGQPGWGAPPPGYPPQPGYGGQPAWGAPPPPKKKGHGCLIAFLVVLALIVLGVGGCVFLVKDYISTDIKLYQDLGTNRVSSVSFDSNNGVTTWVIHLKAGYDTEAQAHQMACDIVWVDLQGTQFAKSPFELVDSSGFVVASDQDTCP